MMKNQKGLGLVELIIWVVIAAAVCAFVYHAIDVYFIEPAVKVATTKQMAADEIVLEQVKADRDKWQAAEQSRELENRGMQSELEGLKGTLRSLDKLTAARVARSAALAAEALKGEADAKAESERLRVLAQGPAKSGTADEKLKRIEAEQIRFFGIVSP
jgi:Tfp pilus assembly protein PilE